MQFENKTWNQTCGECVCKSVLNILSIWLLNGQIDFLLFLRFYNTWPWICSIFFSIHFYHWDMRNVISIWSNWFFIFLHFNPLSPGGVAGFRAGTCLAEALNSVAKGREMEIRCTQMHRMGTSCELGWEDLGRLNLFFFFFLLSALIKGPSSLHQDPGLPSLCLYWTLTLNPMRASLISTYWMAR